jgi:isocitrate dehydrogenase
LYWAQAMAEQAKNQELQEKFSAFAKELTGNESRIAEELIAAQGKPVDIGGYYHPDAEKVEKAMRPSATLNTALANF